MASLTTIQSDTVGYVAKRDQENSQATKYQQVSTVSWSSSVSGKEFHGAITAAKTHNIEKETKEKAYLTKDSKQHGAFVHAYSAEEYSQMKTFLLNEGSVNGVAGVAVKSGDIVSVFKHPDCKVKNVVGNYLLPKAIENDGNRLDCFNGVLPAIYVKSGFEPVSKTPFNRDFAPEDWNYERDGEPEIVFMKHSKNTVPTTDVQALIKELPASKTYEEAQAVQIGRN